MKKRNLLLVILAILLVFGLVIGCGPAEDEEGGEATLLSVSANGSGLETTTQLTLTFDKTIGKSSGINVSLGSGATAGAVSGSGPTYTVSVSGVTADATVSVTVSKKDWDITDSSQTVAVKFSAAEAKYYQTYKCTYASGLTESITISNNSVRFQDNANAPVDFINFTVTKWETVSSLPTMTGYNGNGLTGEKYTKGVKLIGKITDAEPKASGNIYGNTTCPGITSIDLGVTEVYIYFYFTNDTDPLDIYLARSAFFKAGVTGQQNPLSGAQIREYRVDD